jgi:Uma2 family endonuclease
MIATRPLTIAEFESTHYDGLWELIDGEPIPVNPAAGSSSFIASRLGHYLNSYIDEHPLGHVFSSDAGFVLFADRATVRSPDVAFVSCARLPEIPETFIPLAPDLAVEVVSPTDRLVHVQAKVEMYLEAGVPLVWLINPRNQTATVFRQQQPPVIIGVDGALDGEEVLPGFMLPLAKLLA